MTLVLSSLLLFDDVNDELIHIRVKKYGNLHYDIMKAS